MSGDGRDHDGPVRYSDSGMSANQQSIYAALPGVEVPVSRVQDELAHMWEGVQDPGQDEVAEFRASQMNVIIHFGRKTTVEEAVDRFSGTLRFAQRYPCRMIVLCPEETDREDTLMTLKMFAECYVGKSQREKSCCEALILAYPRESRSFLENQVSILLENDLPTYYWFHHFASARNVAKYLSFLRNCKRIVYESGLETPDVAEVPWPQPERVRDLVHARLLPARQSIGQFLSSFDPALLCEGPASIEMRHSQEMEAEARVLLGWFRARLEACADLSGVARLPDSIARVRDAGRGDFPVELRCDYGDGRYFYWKADLARNHGRIEANIDRGKLTLPMSVHLLSLEMELAEAFFF